MKHLKIAILLIITNIVFAQTKQDKCLGIWLTEDKDAKVEIYKVDNKYKGKLIWVAKPNDENGKPKLDNKNPEPKLRSRTILGLEFVWGFVFDGKNTWGDGHIYDPQSGKTYSAEFTIEGDNVMKLRGYVGFTWLGRTSTWTRVK